MSSLLPSKSVQSRTDEEETVLIERAHELRTNKKAKMNLVENVLISTYPRCSASRSVLILSDCCCSLFTSLALIHSYPNNHAVGSDIFEFINVSANERAGDFCSVASIKTLVKCMLCLVLECWMTVFKFNRLLPNGIEYCSSCVTTMSERQQQLSWRVFKTEQFIKKS
jgi:hypothetical protein